MGRIARIVAPGWPHHVVQRGNRRQQTFFTDEDYRAYLSLLVEWCGRWRTRIWAVKSSQSAGRMVRPLANADLGRQVVPRGPGANRRKGNRYCVPRYKDNVLKQHVWGLTYIDELVQVRLNDDPADANESDCETRYWALHNANFNVMGIVESDGDLKERYEYTPYGRRTVFFSPGSNDALCMAPTFHSRRFQVSGADQPYGLCDIGHQGLLHDREFDLVYNRARYLHPRLGRFMQRDPIGYVDGMSSYLCAKDNPIVGRDWRGLMVHECSPISPLPRLVRTKLVLKFAGNDDKAVKAAKKILRRTDIISNVQGLPSPITGPSALKSLIEIAADPSKRHRQVNSIVKAMNPIRRTGFADVYIRITWDTCDPAYDCISQEAGGELKRHEVEVKCVNAIGSSEGGAVGGSWDMQEIKDNTVGFRDAIEGCMANAYKKANEKWKDYTPE